MSVTFRRARGSQCAPGPTSASAERFYGTTGHSGARAGPPHNGRRVQKVGTGGGGKGRIIVGRAQSKDD